MACGSLKEIIKLLEKTERFKLLIDRYKEDSKDQSFWFELAFVCWMESKGSNVKYEVNANPDNDSSIDFALDLHECRCLFELLRIENSDKISAHIEAQKEQDPLFESYQLLLKSDPENPHFKTAAQTIRMQEKILEKVRKFPVPEQTILSIIVCDCSTIHLGMLDDEDVRIAMFGKSRSSILQEHWNGARLKGMYETSYKFRNSDDFRKRINAVIFVPKLEPNGLEKAMITLNPEMDDEKKEKILDILKGIKCLENIKLIESTL